MIWFQGQPRHVSYLQKNPHLMSFLYHYMSMFLISPPFFFLACFSLYFLIFFISYLLRPVLVPWPRLLSVCVYLLSVPWATNWDTKNKKSWNYYSSWFTWYFMVLWLCKRRDIKSLWNQRYCLPCQSKHRISWRTGLLPRWSSEPMMNV